MLAFVLVHLAVLVAIGQAFQTPAWARELSLPLGDVVPNTWSSLAARSPRRGGGGSSGDSGGGSSDDDDSDDDEPDEVPCDPERELDLSTDNCHDTEKTCLGGCISKDKVCCVKAALPAYCESDERCVVSTTSDGLYKCCPANDSSCDGGSSSSSRTWPAQYRYVDNSRVCGAGSGAGQSAIGGMEALVGGVVLSFAVGIAH